MNEKTYIIRAVAFANGVPCPHSGQFVQSFDHDAFNGRGYGVFTDEPDRALRFATAADAMAFWRKQSTVQTLRLDGKPNRPLTALTAVIEQVL